MLVGCNQILGTTSVERRDGSVFDAHLDAATTCTDLPSFSRGFIQVVPQNCVSYTISASTRTAAALCNVGGAVRSIETGPLDMALVPAVGFPQNTFTNIRLSADGARITLIYTSVSTTTMWHAGTFHRDGDHWAAGPDILVLPMQIQSVSEITNGPNAHVLVELGSGEVRELEEQTDDSWLEVARDVAPPAGFQSGQHLSGDGLHTWGPFGGNGLTLLSRAGLGVPFTRVGLMPGTNGLLDGFLTDDCGALYFSTLDNVWAAPRLP